MEDLVVAIIYSAILSPLFGIVYWTDLRYDVRRERQVSPLSTQWEKWKLRLKDPAHLDEMLAEARYEYQRAFVRGYNRGNADGLAARTLDEELAMEASLDGK